MTEVMRRTLIARTVSFLALALAGLLLLWIFHAQAVKTFDTGKDQIIDRIERVERLLGLPPVENSPPAPIEQ